MTGPSPDPAAPTAAPTEPLPSCPPPAAWTRTTTAGPASAPALTPPTWSGRKTAVAAALALGLGSIGAVAAAAAVPAGVQGVLDGRGGPGQLVPGNGRQPGPGGGLGGPSQLPGQGVPGQVVPGQGMPGQTVPGDDPGTDAR